MKSNIKSTKLALLTTALDIHRVKERRMKKYRRLCAGTIELYQDWLVFLNKNVEHQIREIILCNTFVDALENLIYKNIVDPHSSLDYIRFKLNYRNLMSDISTGCRSKVDKTKHLGATCSWVSVPAKSPYLISYTIIIE